MTGRLAHRIRALDSRIASTMRAWGIPALQLSLAILFVWFGVLKPLGLLPEITFQSGHRRYAPTLEGQYIIKNLLIISAALVVGGTVRRR